MTFHRFGNGQRGATLVVAMIMLMMFMLILSGAFSLSTSNLKSVGNMQMREEALAAANKVVEDVLSTNFIGAGTQSFDIDIDNDGTADYAVQVAAPTCIKFNQADATAPSSVTLAGMGSTTWNTVWLIEAEANNASGSVPVRVRSGVRVLLTDAMKNSHCPV